MEQLIENMNMMMDRLDVIERAFNQPLALSAKPSAKPSAVRVSTGKRSKIESLMPWTGVVNNSWCLGLKVNHGLYTQCDGTRISDKDFCKTCHSQGVKNGSNEPNSGTVKGRLSSGLMDYTDKRTGKKCVSWLKILKKCDITVDDALKTATYLNINIPEEQMIECDNKRGRPKKIPVTTEEEGGVGDESPKKRGRPKKSKKEVETVAGDDLIANLILNLDAGDTEALSDELEMEMVEEESTEVRKLTIDGTDYLVDESNTVYDIDSQDEIGSYNPELNSITRDGL